MMMNGRMLILLALIALLGACDEDRPRSGKTGAQKPTPTAGSAPGANGWPLYRGNAALNGVASGRLPDQGEIAWTFETKGAVTASPVVQDGVVYVGSCDQKMYAIDLKTGKEIWSFETDDMIEAPAMVFEGRLYFGSCDFFFYALDSKTGELKWKYETGEKIMGSPSGFRAKDGTLRVVVGSHDGSLYCFNGAGQKMWTYTTDNFVNGTPAMLDGKIVFGGCDAVLHIVSTETGGSLDKIELGADCHVAGSVALAGGKVFFGHYGNQFICADLEEAKLEWDYPSPRHGFFSSPAIGKDRVVFGGRDRHIHCVGRSDGKPKWKFKTGRKVDASPVICGNRVVCGSGDGRLYVIDLKTGKKVWSYEIGQPIFSSAAVVDGMIIVGSNDKRLYAFKSGM